MMKCEDFFDDVWCVQFLLFVLVGMLCWCCVCCCEFVFCVDDLLWYKDVIIYQVYVKLFYDLNNDGIGDFFGLIVKFDYIVEFGVDMIWLLLFYLLLCCDDGYDIVDYCDVYFDYGMLVDVWCFICEVYVCGICVIVEFVINYMLDQYLWFQCVCCVKLGFMYCDYYVWFDIDMKYVGM